MSSISGSRTISLFCFILRGGTGIGLEIARQFGLHGANVAIMGRRLNVLQEAVSNVLDNALKYVLVRGNNPSRPSVVFTLQPCDTPLKGVEVVIQDNGAGLADDELSMLCKEGFRGRLCADVAGTGLGLHITRQLVELLNGALLLERASDGTGLSVRIQMREAPA